MKKTFSAPSEIEKFTMDVGVELLNSEKIRIVTYNVGDPGASEALNRDLLKDISVNALVYAIHVHDGRAWQVKYIGQTQAKTSRQRIRNHLFKKNYRTGSQLARIMESVTNGIDIGISYVQIEPPYMRHPVEAILISRFGNKLEWNKHGR